MTHHGCAATKQTHRIRSPINIDTGRPFTTGTGPGFLKVKDTVPGLHALGSSFCWEGNCQVKFVHPVPARGATNAQRGMILDAHRG